MNAIKGRRIISKPGAAIEVTQLELTDAARRSLTMPTTSHLTPARIAELRTLCDDLHSLDSPEGRPVPFVDYARALGSCRKEPQR